MSRQLSKAGRIRALARDCGAAFLLTMSVLTALPYSSYESPPAIVRMARQDRGDFDEREWVGSATVLTVPLTSVDQHHFTVAHGQPERDRLN